MPTILRRSADGPQATVLYNMEDFLRECHNSGIVISQSGFDDYLTDESHFRGHAWGLARPRTEKQIVHLVRLANQWNVPLTVVSGKTSLTGGPVPLGGVILDVKGLDDVDPNDPTTVGPGIILKNYKDLVESNGLFYPPDPTSEDSCTIGGNVACNASGPLSYLYGPTRDYVRGMTVCLGSGTVLDINRGDVVSNRGALRVPADLLDPRPAEDLVIPVPSRGAPPWKICKSAAGLYSSDPMDLADLFIGSEGILGVATRIRTILLPRRSPYIALMLYLPAVDTAADLVTLLDLFKRFFHDGDKGVESSISDSLKSIAGPGIRLDIQEFRDIFPSCMEWFGSSVSRFLSDERAEKLRTSYGALYVEQEYDRGEDPLDKASQWSRLVDLLESRRSAEYQRIETEVALDAKQIRSLRRERQSIPEKLAASIRPGMVKIGTDFSVPPGDLKWLMSLYDENLPEGRSYVFGHIGNAHIHSNMLPDNQIEAKRFRAITRHMAREVCRIGGSVSGEHGIGKLKHEYLEIMLGRKGIEEIRKIKRILDPQGILNVHNVIPGRAIMPMSDRENDK